MIFLILESLSPPHFVFFFKTTKSPHVDETGLKLPVWCWDYSLEPPSLAHSFLISLKGNWQVTVKRSKRFAVNIRSQEEGDEIMLFQFSLTARPWNYIKKNKRKLRDNGQESRILIGRGFNTCLPMSDI